MLQKTIEELAMSHLGKDNINAIYDDIIDGVDVICVQYTGEVIKTHKDLNLPQILNGFKIILRRGNEIVAQNKARKR